MPKEKRWIFLGDTHAEPEGIWTRDRLTKRHKRQWWLNEQFDTALGEIATLTKKYTVTLAHGGDTTNRPSKAARDAITERLLPIASKVADMWGVVGTPYHAGTDGEEDRQVYQELGIKPEKVSHGHRLIENGRRIWWAHHGAGLGVDPYMGLANTAKKIANTCIRKGREFPDWLVFHHTHEYTQSEYATEVRGEWKRVRAVVCPCWQLPNDYSAKKLMWREPSIGYLIYNPQTSEMTPRLFRVPEGLLYG